MSVGAPILVQLAQPCAVQKGQRALKSEGQWESVLRDLPDMVEHGCVTREAEYERLNSFNFLRRHQRFKAVIRILRMYEIGNTLAKRATVRRPRC